ncbi:MAG: SPOR domain-containing protein [Salinibacter sp.]
MLCFPNPLMFEARLLRPVRMLYLATGVLLGGGLLLSCSVPLLDQSSGPTAPEPGTRIYLVQLQLTEDKGRAAAILSQGQRWWENIPSSNRPPLVPGIPSSTPAVTIEWKAPYYRVRLGPFATEKQAQRVLEAARSSFPDAFVVPDRVEDSS